MSEQTMTPIDAVVFKVIEYARECLEVGRTLDAQVINECQQTAKRVLSERVPARPGAGYTNPNSASEAEGWNDCREYLGLED